MSAHAAAGSFVLPARWLRSRSFDLTLILGVAGLALAAGAAVAIDPRLFLPLVLLDIWLLGYHHVIATFTRLAFDGQSLRRHRFLVFGLPPLVLLAVAVLVLGVGAWTVATIYFYWQWFHYVRQSWGLSQAFRRAGGGSVPEPEALLHAVIWLVPTWGILHRCAQQPDAFLGMPMLFLPVPMVLADAVGIVALATSAAWLVLRLRAARSGGMPVLQTLYIVSHLVIFYVGYVLIEDVSHGWLVANIWHNAQYVLFVWLQNNRRYEGRPDPQARLLSWLSQRRNMRSYFIVCLSISSIFYAALALGLDALSLPIVIGAAIAYQTINFHHYIVDAIIWRSGRGRAAARPAGAGGPA